MFRSTLKLAFRSSFRKFTSNAAEQKASQLSGSAQAQSDLYRQMLDQGASKQLVERVESRQYALDLEGARLYVEALNRLGRGEQALKHVMEHFSSGKRSSYGTLSQSARYEQPPSRYEAPHSSSRYEAPRYDSLRQEQFPLNTSQGTKDAPLHVIARNPPPTTGERVMTMLKYSLVVYLVLAVYTTFTDEIGKLMGGAASKSAALYNEFDPTSEKNKDKITRFSDVQGVDEAKDELLEVVEFLKDPTKFTRLGGKLPKGILLTGPPGTGKTLLARAIAGEANVPFIHTSGSEFDEVFVGVGSARVRALFAAARKKAGPCIIFIDEIDAVGGKRHVKDQQFMRQTLNQLLVELDGFDQSAGIIVIGATNFPENLDKALTRPGRFDRVITVDAPNVTGRLEILKVHTKLVPLSNNVKLNIIARGTTGFTGAELANLINYAALRAATTAQIHVTQDDLEWARDRIIMGSERKSYKLEAKAKELVAYHEAGHALVAHLTEGTIPLHKATIVPRGSALGMVTQLPETDDPNSSRKQFKARMDVCMGGRCSEELIYGYEDVTAGASSDIKQATRIARAMVIKYGMGSKAVGNVDMASEEGAYENLSPEMKAQIDHDVRQLVEDSHTRAAKLLHDNKVQLERLAKALLTYETLSKEEIEAAVIGQPINRPVFE